MADLLELLVRAESPSDDPSAQGPMLELLSNAFAKRGFRPQVLPGKTSGGMLFAMPAKRPRFVPHQLVLGHCDTVWPIGTLESMPIKTDGGIFWGPGSYDMKAGLVQGLFALEALDAAGVDTFPVTPAPRPPRGPMFRSRTLARPRWAPQDGAQGRRALHDPRPWKGCACRTRPRQGSKRDPRALAHHSETLRPQRRGEGHHGQRRNDRWRSQPERGRAAE
jgi:hypothetical protein